MTTQVKSHTQRRSARPGGAAQRPRAIQQPSWQTLGLTKPGLPPDSKRCECCACGEFFSNDNNFLTHRAFGRCLTPEELRERRLELNPQGIWVRAGSNPHAQED